MTNPSRSWCRKEAGHVLLHDPAAPGGPTVTTAGFCQGTVEIEAESLAYLVAAAHGLATDDYTFPYVTGWAAGITGTPPEQAVRDTAGRVLTAARTVLAVTAPDTAPTVDGPLAARVHAGAQRTAAARAQAEMTPALSAAQPGPAAPQPLVEVLVRLHADAAAFYTAQLAADTPDAARARAMLEQRAVAAAAVAAYQVGYASPGWTALTDHLHGLGYTDPQLLAAGAWPTTTNLPAGHDPASLTQQHEAAALTTALQAVRPLAELVIDERLAGWAGRLHWPEGRIGAARDTAQIIAALPPEHVGPQVARLADRLGLDPATITAAVLDALTGPNTASSPIAGCIVGIQQRVINSGLRGAVAAMAMSGTRALTSSLGLIEQTPPEAVLHQSAPATMAKVPKQRQAAVAELAHWAFGVVAGAGFGLLPLGLCRYRWAGAAYGVVVLTGFEVGIAGARAVPGPTCRPVERVIFLADHLLFGIVLAPPPHQHA